MLRSLLLLALLSTFITGWAQNPSADMGTKTVLLAILAKDKAHTLPTFLGMDKEKWSSL